MLNSDRVGLDRLFFMPAVWQVSNRQASAFLRFLWDGCDKKPLLVERRVFNKVLREKAS
jgi:hypothetical protein